MSIELIANEAHDPNESPAVLRLPNDADALTVSLEGVQRIELHFPKFTDGRAFSQAFLLRRRRGFAGDIRATGDVLTDQLLQMQRTGFTSAVLKPNHDPADAARQLSRYTGFYQGDTLEVSARFKKAA